MARPARSIQEVEEVREEILRRAAEILAEEGYAGLSMAKIGARMKMTSPNVYNYFANKEHVYLEIHNRVFGLFYERLRAAVDAAPDPASKIGEFVKAYVEFGIENSRYYEIMFCIHTPKYSDYVGTPLEEIVLEARQLSLKLLELAIATLKEVSPRLSADGDGVIESLIVRAWATLHGLVSLYNNRMLAAAVDDPERLVREIVGKVMADVGVTSREKEPRVDKP